MKCQWIRSPGLNQNHMTPQVQPYKDLDPISYISVANLKASLKEKTPSLFQMIVRHLTFFPLNHLPPISQLTVASGQFLVLFRKKRLSSAHFHTIHWMDCQSYHVTLLISFLPRKSR